MGRGLDRLRDLAYVVTALRILDEDEDRTPTATQPADTPSFAEQLGLEERETVQRLLDRRGTHRTAGPRPGPALGDEPLALVGTRNELLIQPVIDPPTEMAQLARILT